MNRVSQILDLAEKRMRQVGYNAVSFRELAVEIGVKSASLHYHFPKKQDLGVALVKRYSENFQSRLDEETAGLTEASDKILSFAKLFREAQEEQGLMCLCAILGAESAGLPLTVTTEIRAFFERHIVWLSACYEALGQVDIETETKASSIFTPQERAKATLSMLEGAMIVSAVNQDVSVLDAAISRVSYELSYEMTL